MSEEQPHTVLDARAQGVADRLHGQGRREVAGLIAHFTWRSLAFWLRGKRFTEPGPDDMVYLRDKLIPLDRPKCELCYLLCRSVGAKRVAEIGTSFGASTIYLAAAIRDGGGGVAIGTEIDADKVRIARQNLAEAGLGDYVDVREGDALQSLKDPGGPVDFLLIDSWIGLARPAIEMLAPRLRPGAIVMCDNTADLREQYRDYLEYVRNPANGFRSINAPYRGGVELSVRITPPA